jgi:hypothetical protein
MKDNNIAPGDPRSIEHHAFIITNCCARRALKPERHFELPSRATHFRGSPRSQSKLVIVLECELVCSKSSVLAHALALALDPMSLRIVR